jgi:hypothetical protein
MTDYDHGDWVRYKGISCRVLGHWHDKQWTDYLILGVPDGIEDYAGGKRVTRWKYTGKALPDRVELIKRRPRNDEESES